MNWLALPPLNSLRAFCALAETGGYTAAARQLGVTHAAVKQQVKALEDRLGVTLATRVRHGVSLTEEGLMLARDLEIGFHSITRGVERLEDLTAGRPVQITMSSAFAVEWLMPRLPSFRAAYPDITLMLNPTGEVLDLRPGGIDIAVRYRDRRQPTSAPNTVLISDMIVVATRELVAGRDLSDPASLLELPWLEELGTNEVAEWFTLHGVVPDQRPTVLQMPGNLIMPAVRRGDGLTYTARAFFREDLASGRMVELFSEPGFGHYIVETRSEPLRPAVRTVLKWLLSEAEVVTV